MVHYTDQLGKTIRLEQAPRRIVSLVPSQTELLFYLGLDAEVVGITKFCVHPDAWFRTKTRVGGTKQLNIEKIRSLSPDLIIANKEENMQEQVEALEAIAPVWTSDIRTVGNALNMIGQVGKLVDRELKAKELIEAINRDMEQLPLFPDLRTAYLIWNEPYMSVGSDTFIHDMLCRAGFQNVFGDRERYPAITLEDLQQAAPELVLLSSEPYPFRQAHADKLSQALPAATIALTDGELFSWYGSRMLHVLPFLRSSLPGSR